MSDSTVLKLREFQAKLSSVRRSIERYLSGDSNHCENCCFATKVIKPDRWNDRYNANVIAGASNYLVCMCGCDKRDSIPTLVRPWQPACKSFVDWVTYHRLRDPNDHSWTPESLKIEV